MFDEIHEECGVFGAYRVDNAKQVLRIMVCIPCNTGVRKRVVLPFQMAKISLYRKEKA